MRKFLRPVPPVDGSVGVTQLEDELGRTVEVFAVDGHLARIRNGRGVRRKGEQPKRRSEQERGDCLHENHPMEPKPNGSSPWSHRAVSSERLAGTPTPHHRQDRPLQLVAEITPSFDDLPSV